MPSYAIEPANSEGLKVEDTRGTAVPYGFYGFGVAALLCSACFWGVGGVPGDAAIFGPGIITGGFAQLFTGLYEISRGNEVGGTIFGCFGTFWCSYAIMKIPAVFAWTQLYATQAQFNGFWGLYNFSWAVAVITWIPIQFGGTVCHFALTILALGNFIQFGMLGFIPEAHLRNLQRSLGTWLFVSGLLGFYMASSIFYEKHNPLFKLPMGVLGKNQKKKESMKMNKLDDSTRCGNEVFSQV